MWIRRILEARTLISSFFCQKSDAQINISSVGKGVTMQRNECPQANKWRTCAGLKAKNQYDQADLLWIAWGEGKPYSWKTMKEHWRLFKDDRL